MLTVTPDINLGNLIVTGSIAACGWGLRRLYLLVEHTVEAQKRAITDLNDHAEVINLHTDVIVEAGLLKGAIGIPRVAERRQRVRSPRTTLGL